jgi:hypothetical protein
MTDRYTIPWGTTADQVLYVLNGCSTVALSSVRWIVITGIHTPAEGEPAWPFTPGEMLVECEERVFPHGPSLDAWDTCAYSRPGGLEKSRALAEFIKAGAGRGVYQWDGERWYRPADQVDAMACLNSVGDGEGLVFVGDTDAVNRWGMDIRYPGSYTWPTPSRAL